MIVPVAFSLTRSDAPEEFSVDRVLADVVSAPDWKVDVEVAVYDTETQRGYGFKGRLVRQREENSLLNSMGTLYESKGDRLPAFGSREYLLELRAEVDRLLTGDTGRPNRFALFSDEELHALAEMTSSRTTSEGLSLHRRRMMGQVQLERQRRIETTTGEST